MQSLRDTTAEPTPSPEENHLELRDAHESGSKTTSSTSSKETHKSDSSNGSPLDMANQANKEKARSLLGLTVCLVAGVAWF